MYEYIIKRFLQCCAKNNKFIPNTHGLLSPSKIPNLCKIISQLTKLSFLDNDFVVIMNFVSY